MELAVRFIVASAYDFVAADGKRVAGINAQCYDAYSKQIIKVKVLHPEVIADLEFGDDLTVHCVPRGKYLNYEV